MSKKNKKKKNVASKKPLQSYLVITKTYFDDFVNTAHKFMLLIGLESSAFDALSKRTKQNLMLVRHTPYRIRAEKDNRVPLAYLKFFNGAMSYYEKTTFFGDPSFNISFLEYVTFGLTLIFAFRNYDRDMFIVAPDQIELLEKIKIPLLKYVDEHEEDHYAVRTGGILMSLFLYVTQPNYRYYTCKEGGYIDSLKGRMENVITVSSIQPERKKFHIEGKTHSAFRLGYYNPYSGELTPSPVMAEISIKLLEKHSYKSQKQVQNQIETDINLPVFIQSHALRRSAERMDCKDNGYRNMVFAISFLVPKVVKAVNGQLLIAALGLTCKPVGYFPFSIQDGAVLLLSFLPLSSPITPEGSVLNKELGIQLEDSKYIGLDKLSFFTNTDFETVPIVKQAIIKAGMWHLTEIIPTNPSEKKEDRILRNFFVNNQREVAFAEEYDIVR